MLRSLFTLPKQARYQLRYIPMHVRISNEGIISYLGIKVNEKETKNRKDGSRKIEK